MMTAAVAVDPEMLTQSAIDDRIIEAGSRLSESGRRVSMAALAEASGLSRYRVSLSPVAQAMCERLPPNERLQAALELISASAATQDDMTRRMVERAAGTSFDRSPEVLAEFRRRKAGLPMGARSVQAEPGSIPTGRGFLLSSGLRADVRTLMWSYLEWSARTGRAVRARFSNLRTAERVLVRHIPDVRGMRLPQLQRAWAHSDLAGHAAQNARSGLRDLLEVLVLDAIEDESLDGAELARCAEWLAQTRVSEPRPSERALTAAESDDLVAACLRSILAGHEKASSLPDLAAVSTHSRAHASASAIVDWGLALMVLVARFTGLRIESLARLRTADIHEIGPSTYGLTWRHGKKNEERMAVVPASVAFLMLEYARALDPVRRRLDTEVLFIRQGRGGTWAPADARMSHKVVVFIRRSSPGLDPEAATLTAMRRTFATRALAEGRSIYAVAAQLGHVALSTTLGYVKWDRAEHAVETRGALDRFGRVVLDRWHRPRLAEELSESDRAGLYAQAAEVSCEVGLCSAGSCVMLDGPGAPPPCQACEHLVTDPGFFPAWENDLEHRRLRVMHLSGDARFGTVAASEEAQLAEIERIYADLRAEARA